jgi:hypothetical protein
MFRLGASPRELAYAGPPTTLQQGDYSRFGPPKTMKIMSPDGGTGILLCAFYDFPR